MKRRNVLGLAALAALPAIAAAPPQEVHMFKNPNCGCCGQWADHLRAAGFSVKITMSDDTSAVRRKAGIPDKYGSCHTAFVGGYALEGHVPAAEVRRLLATKPQAIGLAVPGMPMSAPGMDVPGAKDRYDVLLIDKQGASRVFAAYPKA